jgi:hypothetical protein
MSVSAAAAHHFVHHLTPFETVFVHAVLEHRGVYDQPSSEDFSAALQVLRQFDALCVANPGWDSVYAPRADSDDMPALRAKAFLMFGTISPTPAQWHKAHVALFGPLICETCG